MTHSKHASFAEIAQRLRNSPGPRSETPEERRERQAGYLKGANEDLQLALSENPDFFKQLSENLSDAQGIKHSTNKDILAYPLTTPEFNGGGINQAIYLVKVFRKEEKVVDSFEIGVFGSSAIGGSPDLFDTTDWTSEIDMDLKVMCDETIMTQCLLKFELPG